MGRIEKRRGAVEERVPGVDVIRTYREVVAVDQVARGQLLRAGRVDLPGRLVGLARSPRIAVVAGDLEIAEEPGVVANQIAARGPRR